MFRGIFILRVAIISQGLLGRAGGFARLFFVTRRLCYMGGLWT